MSYQVWHNQNNNKNSEKHNKNIIPALKVEGKQRQQVAR